MVRQTAFVNITRSVRKFFMGFPNSIAFTSGKPLPSASTFVRTMRRAPHVSMMLNMHIIPREK